MRGPGEPPEAVHRRERVTRARAREARHRRSSGRISGATALVRMPVRAGSPHAVRRSASWR